MSVVASSPGSPPAHRPLARVALDRMLAHALIARLFLAPAIGSMAITFAYFEPVVWRKCFLMSAVAIMSSLSLREWLRYRRFGLTVVQIPLNVLVTVFAQLIIISASGGLFSPGLPVIFMMTIATALLGDLRTLLVLLGMAIPSFWVLATVHYTGRPVHTLIPVVFGAPGAFERGMAPWFAASLASFLLGVAARVGRALQRLFEELFDDAVRERDRSLELHAEQARTLTLLSSEIAHELKNPLASLKGLGALVAKDVEGKTAERVRVLRGEVDRMQSIIDEFLTFSRPLVPLSVASSDLGELTRDVARLCEGNAHERGVALDVQDVGGGALRCDKRKVRQVLINLLQNAIEATPRGGTVRLAVVARGRALSARIIDEGQGLPSELAERVFEPFVTSKEQGSGIGLVVARALARQHGGDVSLRARGDARGLVAELTLPIEPVGAAP